MILANNGILIVVLTMWLGVHLSNKWLMVAALAMAGLSYLVNLIDGHEMDAPGARAILFGSAMAVGVMTYVYAGLLLL